MPLISSSYRAPLVLTNPHIHTVIAAMLPTPGGIRWTRERISTPDSDFLDIDSAHTGSKRAVIVCHGLEGSARSSYVQTLAAEALREGWDVLAMNYRGCSGEPNLRLRLYHSGAIEDLSEVVRFAASRYQSLALMGFSLGANLCLLFASQGNEELRRKISSVVAVAAPCDLAGSAEKLSARRYAPYMRYFLGSLKRKIRGKSAQFPGALNLDGLEKIQTFFEYDDRFTAPLHGFSGAADYYARCSSGRVLDQVRIPTLIINAEDDPFLSVSCHPRGIASQSQYIHLELLKRGGHVAALEHMNWTGSQRRYHDRRALQFMNQFSVKNATTPENCRKIRPKVLSIIATYLDIFGLFPAILIGAVACAEAALRG
jgi:predicted alpha/beta-fold hydrolase